MPIDSTHLVPGSDNHDLGTTEVTAESLESIWMGAEAPPPVGPLTGRPMTKKPRTMKKFLEKTPAVMPNLVL